MVQITDLLRLCQKFWHHKIRDGLMMSIYQYFEIPVYDDDYIAFLITINDWFEDQIGANMKGIEMYKATGRVEALIIYAFADSDWMKHFYPDTLDKLLFELQQTTDPTIKCALLLLIADHYYGKNIKVSNEEKYLYYINESLKILPTPKAFLKLAEYIESGGKKEVEDNYIKYLMSNSSVSIKEGIINKYLSINSTHSLTEFYRNNAINCIKLMTPDSCSDTPDFLTIEGFCNRNIFEFYIGKYRLIQYFTNINNTKK